MLFNAQTTSLHKQKTLTNSQATTNNTNNNILTLTKISRAKNVQLCGRSISKNYWLFIILETLH